MAEPQTADTHRIAALRAAIAQVELARQQYELAALTLKRLTEEAQRHG